MSRGAGLPPEDAEETVSGPLRTTVKSAPGLSAKVVDRPSTLAEVVERLAKLFEDDGKDKLVDTVVAYFDLLDPVADADRIEMLETDLLTVKPELLGARWLSLLDRFVDRSSTVQVPTDADHSP